MTRVSRDAEIWGGGYAGPSPVEADSGLTVRIRPVGVE